MNIKPKIRVNSRLLEPRTKRISGEIERLFIEIEIIAVRRDITR